MVDSWFLKENNAIGTVLLCMCIIALLFAIVSISDLGVFLYFIGLAMVFCLAGTYCWSSWSHYFFPQKK